MSRAPYLGDYPEVLNKHSETLAEPSLADPRDGKAPAMVARDSCLVQKVSYFKANLENIGGLRRDYARQQHLHCQHLPEHLNAHFECWLHSVPLE